MTKIWNWVKSLFIPAKEDCDGISAMPSIADNIETQELSYYKEELIRKILKCDKRIQELYNESIQKGKPKSEKLQSYMLGKSAGYCEIIKMLKDE